MCQWKKDYEGTSSPWQNHSFIRCVFHRSVITSFNNAGRLCLLDRAIDILWYFRLRFHRSAREKRKDIVNTPQGIIPDFCRRVSLSFARLTDKTFRLFARECRNNVDTCFFLKRNVSFICKSNIATGFPRNWQSLFDDVTTRWNWVSRANTRSWDCCFSYKIADRLTNSIRVSLNSLYSLFFL